MGFNWLVIKLGLSPVVKVLVLRLIWFIYNWFYDSEIAASFETLGLAKFDYWFFYYLTSSSFLFSTLIDSITLSTKSSLIKGY